MNLSLSFETACLKIKFCQSIKIVYIWVIYVCGLVILVLWGFLVWFFLIQEHFMDGEGFMITAWYFRDSWYIPLILL